MFVLKTGSHCEIVAISDFYVVKRVTMKNGDCVCDSLVCGRAV